MLCRSVCTVPALRDNIHLSGNNQSQQLIATNKRQSPEGRLALIPSFQ
jgi:hypothetical protein